MGESRNRLRSNRGELLRSLLRDSSPALYSFGGCLAKMSLSAPCNYRSDSFYAELGTLLDCPLHAVKLEY